MQVFKAAASLEAPLKAPGGGDSADTALTETISVGEEPEESSSQVRLLLGVVALHVQFLQDDAWLGPNAGVHTGSMGSHLHERVSA